MQAAADIPIIEDSALFVSAEEERLRAMEDAQTGATDEQRLVATLVVTNLYEQQTEAIREDVMPDLEQRAGQADAAQAVEWIQAWLPAAETGLQQWADYQRQLVDRIGLEEAERLAEGPATARIQGVINAAKARVIERGRAMGIDVDAALTREERPAAARAAEETKLCPDCAEEIKAAARKCRFCGYRFDEPSG
ncbi:MAG: hypothetical protein M3065_02875 [Actinomycetota bacterium]|nr:hypothetical protein [Actinomycetota bacterium]